MLDDDWCPSRIMRAGEVINVLAGAAKMHEFADRVGLGVSLMLL